MKEPARSLAWVGALVVLVALALWLLRMVRTPGADAVDPRRGGELTLATPERTVVIGLEALRQSVAEETVTVAADPSYAGRSKRYIGFSLERVLALAGLRPAAGQVLYFQAADGYRATLEGPIDADGVRGLVAYAEPGVAHRWEPLAGGKSPAPFYLVWSGRDSAQALRRPWPYQLVRIEVVDPRRKYDRIFPAGVAESDPVYRGYRAFVIDSHGGDQCVACHSLNLQGGTVGPELNVPRNITEYRDDATLTAFIRDARQFRARSAMPPFQGVLSDQQIADILAYLRWLKDHKVPVDSAR